MIRSLVITAGQEHGDAGWFGATGPVLPGGVSRQPRAGARTAIDLLTSKHDRQVAEGVRAVWERWGRQTLDLGVLLRSRGLVPAEDALTHPLERSGQAGAVRQVEAAAHAAVRESVTAAVRSHELVLYLLSGQALAALSLPLPVPDRVQQIVLTDDESLSLVPDEASLHAVVADGPTAARRWHVKAEQVRGFLFRRVCRQIEHHGPAVLEWVCFQPQELELLFYKRTRWRPQFPLW